MVNESTKYPVENLPGGAQKRAMYTDNSEQRIG